MGKPRTAERGQATAELALLFPAILGLVAGLIVVIAVAYRALGILEAVYACAQINAEQATLGSAVIGDGGAGTVGRDFGESAYGIGFEFFSGAPSEGSSYCSGRLSTAGALIPGLLSSDPVYTVSLPTQPFKSVWPEP